MTAPQPIEKPADDPRISAALAKIESLLTPGETLGAYAVQRRYKALTHRLAIVATTSGRLIILNRGLLGGFKMTDVRWQDLANAQIDEGIFSSTLSFTVTPGTVVMKAVTPGDKHMVRVVGLRKAEAQRVYVVAQSQEQAWREKNRVRELEEMRAKSGGVQLGAGIGTSSGPASNPENATARLQQAKEMLTKGLITDAEYETIKAKIFASL